MTENNELTNSNLESAEEPEIDVLEPSKTAEDNVDSFEGSSEQEGPVEVNYSLLQAALDGILFVRNHPVPFPKLAELLDVPVEVAEEVVNLRRKNLEQDPSAGLQIAIVEKGVQLATKAMISTFIQRMEGQKLVTLSMPALETLSVIAFKQPITKAEIDAIRGVNCDGVVSTLLEKKLIYVSGEKPVIGRPRMYSTTQDFLYYFGMKSLKELPVPAVDIPDELTPEGQKALEKADDKQAELDFNESQGLVGLEAESATDDEVTESEEMPL
jgi:segregation and condensation protein B